MAFMSGSPVLSDQRFGQETQNARVAGTAGTGTFTIGGSIVALVVLMALLLVTAAVGWNMVEQQAPITNAAGVVIAQSNPTIPPVVFIGVIVALVAGLATAFKPNIARITAPIYALATGLWVGAISAVYNNYYDGIVTQALVATLAIFTVMLLLYATRIIKVTNKFVMVVVGATLGIGVMYLAAWLFSLFGVRFEFLYDGSPFGVLLSVGIIIVAALNLAIDFAFIEKAADHQVPKYLEWYAAYGVLVTMVWIYLEVLRLLAILNRR